MSTSSKKPSHHVYTVRDGGEQRSDFWTKIGVAFAHNDGKGFSVILEAFPVDGNSPSAPQSQRTKPITIKARYRVRGSQMLLSQHILAGTADDSQCLGDEVVGDVQFFHGDFEVLGYRVEMTVRKAV